MSTSILPSISLCDRGTIVRWPVRLVTVSDVPFGGEQYSRSIPSLQFDLAQICFGVVILLCGSGSSVSIRPVGRLPSVESDLLLVVVGAW